MERESAWFRILKFMGSLKKKEVREVDFLANRAIRMREK